MTSLEVFGAAFIWLSVAFILFVFGSIITYYAVCFMERHTIKRAAWRWKKQGYVDYENLEEYIDRCTEDWWAGVKHENSWCRSQDFKAGIKAAMLHMIRDYVPVYRKPKRNRGKP